jgi:hypothetical protein
MKKFNQPLADAPEFIRVWSGWGFLDGIEKEEKIEKSEEW